MRVVARRAAKAGIVRWAVHLVTSEDIFLRNPISPQQYRSKHGHWHFPERCIRSRLDSFDE